MHPAPTLTVGSIICRRVRYPPASLRVLSLSIAHMQCRTVDAASGLKSVPWHKVVMSGVQGRLERSYDHCATLLDEITDGILIGEQLPRERLPREVEAHDRELGACDIIQC